VKDYFDSWISLMLVAVLIGVGNAQSTPGAQGPVPTIVSRTDLVLVPVVVSDKQGSHLSKLTKDNFRVEEDGKPQTISGFDEITANTKPMRRAAAPFPNSFTNEIVGDPSSRVLIIIALDFLNTTFTDEVFARRALLRYLGESVRPNMLVSLVTIDSTGLHIIHDFTTNPAVLVATLKGVNSGNTRLDTNDQEALEQGMEAQDRITMATEMASVSNLVNPDFIRAAAQPNIINANVANAREAQAIQTTMEGLQHLAQSCASVAGRKSLIWATGSFPYLTHDVNEMTGLLNPDLYQRAFQMLANANIAVYPVDVRGLSSSSASRYDPNRPQQLSSNIADRAATLRASEIPNVESVRESSLSSMRTFADMTGGQAFINANDLQQSMVNATNDSTSYYLLTYYLSKDSSKKPGWHKLKVSVAQEGAKVRSRSGFFVSHATLDPEASRRIDEQVALDSPIDYTAMPMLLTWKEVQGGGKKNKANFILQVAPEVIRIQENKVNLDFLGVARSAKGEEAGKFSQNLSKDLNPDGVRQIQTGGITYTNTFQLPPGDYHVRVVVRDNATGLMGSVLAPLKVQ
jgi:VWFA-related protein